MKKPTIGFIGRGVMGRPMARHMAGAGSSLGLYDRERAAADPMSGEFEQVQTLESP